MATLILGLGLFFGLVVWAQPITPAKNKPSSAPTTGYDATPKIQLEHPKGGWNVAGLTDATEGYNAAYPNNLIDRGRQKGRTIITGRLHSIGKQRLAPKIIINGSSMPLYTGEQGEFSRPFVFGQGSNSVEVRSGQGDTVKRVQFFETNTTKTQAKLRAILSWDDTQAEVDMHVLTPDGQHAFFGHPILKTGGGLDVDSVDGPGPEMFSMAAPPHGLYQIYINYWGNFGASGYHFDNNTRQKPVNIARITLIFNENTVNEKREFFVIPLRKIGDLTLVRAFNY